MVEFCIYFNNFNVANCFIKRVCKFINLLGGILVNISTNSSFSVLIAVKKEHKAKLKNYLRERIAETILVYYKRNYILSKLNFKRGNNFYMQIYLEALCCFDSNLDKEIILKKLKLKKHFYFDSFIDFVLGVLKNKWNELITIANDNVIYTYSDDNLLELIKFIISNLEHRCYAVNVFSKKDCYMICDIKGEKIDDFLIENNIFYDEKNLFASLVVLNPKKIIFHTDNKKSSVVGKLNSFFSKRVEICK